MKGHESLELLAAKTGDYIVLGSADCPTWSDSGCLCNAYSSHGKSPHDLLTIGVHDDIIELLPGMEKLPEGVSRIVWNAYVRRKEEEKEETIE